MLNLFWVVLIAGATLTPTQNRIRKMTLLSNDLIDDEVEGMIRFTIQKSYLQMRMFTFDLCWVVGI